MYIGKALTQALRLIALRKYSQSICPAKFLAKITIAIKMSGKVKGDTRKPGISAFELRRNVTSHFSKKVRKLDLRKFLNNSLSSCVINVDFNLRYIKNNSNNVKNKKY